LEYSTASAKEVKFKSSTHILLITRPIPIYFREKVTLEHEQFGYDYQALLQSREIVLTNTRPLSVELNKPNFKL